MIGYINQIDSLNKLTEQQKLVIADVTKKYNPVSYTHLKYFPSNS